MRCLSLLLLVISIYSCSPQRRINRIIKRNPELLTKDTIVYRDTIKVESHTVDTTFIHTASNDTVVVEDSVMVIKYVNNGKTVYLKGECKEREVIIEKKIPYDKIVAVTKEVKPWYVKYLWWWLLLTLGVIIGRFAWSLIIKSVKPI